MKRILILVLTLALLLSGTAWGEELERPAAGEAQAAEQTTDGQSAALYAASSTSGTWGTNLTWRFDRSTGTLTISGRGEMRKSTDKNTSYPWSGLWDTATRIVIEEGVTSTADSAFGSFDHVTSVSLPSTLKVIGPYTFDYNTELKSIDIPSGVTRIETRAFMQCWNLKTITFSEGLTEIGDQAFFRTGIQTLDLPKSVRSIGEFAFGDINWKKGYNLVLPRGLKTIGRCAFSSDWCVLGTITIPPTVTYIDYSSVENFAAATILCDAGSYAERFAKAHGYRYKIVDTTPHPTKLTLSRTGTALMTAGETLTLSASAAPADAVYSLSWKSSNTRVATVENGVVRALGEGSARVTAATDNGKSAYVTVKVVDPYKPAGITLSESGTVTLNMGSTLKLGYSLQPASAQSDVTWKSSNARVATVENGVVTPLKEGTVTITVTTAKENRRDSVKVKVVDPYKPAGITLSQSGTVTLNMGSTLRLGYSLQPASAQSDVTWKSSNARVATVENGAVTPLKEGTVTITVTTAKENKRASVKVKVVDPYKPTKVTLDRTGTVQLNLGEVLTLTPSLTPATAQADYTWKTSSERIATVSGGVVTAAGEGAATITVTAVRGNVKKTTRVKVKVVDPIKPTRVSLNETGTCWLPLGNTIQFYPYTEPVDLNPTKGEVTYSWKSSSTRIATVDQEGVVYPVGKGTATITVIAVRGSVKKTASVKVKVVDPDVADTLIIMQNGTALTSMKLGLGQIAFIGVAVRPYTASNVQISYSSSRPQTASVERLPSGEVVVMGLNPGVTKITAKDLISGKKTTMKVTVTK